MTGNESLLRKADIAVSDLSSDGGYLNAEQANRFIRKLIEEPTLLNVVRTVEMRSHTRNIDKVQFASRILRPGTSATALSQADRSKATTEQVQLVTNEVIAEVWLPYDVIEDNIERGNLGQNYDGTGGQGTPAGGGFVDTIQTLIAERAVLDLEELAIRGDDSSTDDYLALTDGYLITSSDNGNTVNNSGGTITKALFRGGLKTMPQQYLRNKAAMFHMISTDNEIEYRDTLANRATALGDQTIQGFQPVFGFGVPVLPVMLMPEDRGLLTNPLNLIWGIQRQIMMEFDKDISARVYKIVVTARIDFQMEEADASVFYDNIGQQT